MGEDPRDVEQRIENTRERMGDTVEALSAKADVPGRVKGYVDDKKDAVTSKVSDAKQKVTGAAGSTGDNRSQVTQAARKSAGIVKENPLGLAIGSAAAGFLLGMALPTSRIEDEHLGPLSDQVKDQAREVGSEAIEHGKELAHDAAHAAAETTKETSQEHASDLQTSVRESARETVEQARS